MPCTYIESEDEKRAAVEKREALWKSRLDKLTKQLDDAYELILAQAYGDGLSDKQLNKIEELQIAHREADLQMLKEEARKRKDFDTFEKVLSADARKPLRKQLGFDPDDY